MTGLLDTPISPADQELAARLMLSSIDGASDRVHSGLMEAISDPNRAVAVIGLLTRHLAFTLVARHGPEKARALLQKSILDAGAAADEQRG